MKIIILLVVVTFLTVGKAASDCKDLTETEYRNLLLKRTQLQTKLPSMRGKFLYKLVSTLSVYYITALYVKFKKLCQ